MACILKLLGSLLVFACMITTFNPPFVACHPSPSSHASAMAALVRCIEGIDLLILSFCLLALTEHRTADKHIVFKTHQTFHNKEVRALMRLARRLTQFKLYHKLTCKLHRMSNGL